MAHARVREHYGPARPGRSTLTLGASEGALNQLAHDWTPLRAREGRQPLRAPSVSGDEEGPVSAARRVEHWAEDHRRHRAHSKGEDEARSLLTAGNR